MADEEEHRDGNDDDAGCGNCDLSRTRALAQTLVGDDGAASDDNRTAYRTTDVARFFGLLRNGRHIRDGLRYRRCGSEQCRIEVLANNRYLACLVCPVHDPARVDPIGYRVVEIVRQLLAGEHTLYHAVEQGSQSNRPSHQLAGLGRAELTVVLLPSDLDQPLANPRIIWLAAQIILAAPLANRLDRVAGFMFS